MGTWNWQAACASRWRRLKQWLHVQANRQRMRRGAPLRVHGILIQFGLETSSNIQEHLITGNYERQEAEGVRSLLTPTDRVLELGSGLGAITCIAGRCASEVLSFEANPRMVKRAEANLALNNVHNATVRSGALGHRNGRASFRVDPHFWTSALDTARADHECIEVAVHDLQEVLETFRPTVVIMDIEGGEYALLQAPAWKAYSGLRSVLVELHDLGGDELNQLVESWAVDRPLEDIREEFARNGNCTVSLQRRA